MRCREETRRKARGMRRLVTRKPWPHPHLGIKPNRAAIALSQRTVVLVPHCAERPLAIRSHAGLADLMSPPGQDAATPDRDALENGDSRSDPDRRRWRCPCDSGLPDGRCVRIIVGVTAGEHLRGRTDRYVRADVDECLRREEAEGPDRHEALEPEPRRRSPGLHDGGASSQDSSVH